MICLDTDVIIDFLRNESDAVKKIRELNEKSELATTSINVFELVKGAIRSKQQNSNEIVEGFLSNLKILNFNHEAAKKSAEIFEDLRKKGENIDVLDLMIASIAIANKTPLFTRNISHFKRISELKIES